MHCIDINEIQIIVKLQKCKNLKSLSHPSDIILLDIRCLLPLSGLHIYATLWALHLCSLLSFQTLLFKCSKQVYKSVWFGWSSFCSLQKFLETAVNMDLRYPLILETFNSIDHKITYQTVGRKGFCSLCMFRLLTSCLIFRNY